MLGFGDLLSPVLHCKQMFAAMVWTSGNQSYIKQTTCGQAPSQWQDSSRNSNCGAIIILHYNLKVKDIRIPTWNFLKNHFIMLFGVSGVSECMNRSRVRYSLAYPRFKDYVPRKMPKQTWQKRHKGCLVWHWDAWVASDGPAIGDSGLP